jgi:hypothetical protein
MYAVVRTYADRGASEVFDTIAKLADDVRGLISGVPGFVSYAAVRTGDGGVTVTVCRDKAGTDESSRRAAGFLMDKLSTPADPPTITEGSTVLQFEAWDQALPVS